MILTIPRWVPWLLGVVAAAAASICALTLMAMSRRPRETRPIGAGGGELATARMDDAHARAEHDARDVLDVDDASTPSERRDRAADLLRRRRGERR